MSTATPLRESGSSPSSSPSTSRHRRRKLVLIVAGVVVAAALATWLVAFSPVLGVRTVSVRGTHVLAGDDVRDAAGVAHGVPLVRVDAAAITRRVDRLPEVASAQVSTSFPSTVEITITERTAVGYVKSKGDDVLLVDRTGVRYRTVHKRPDDVPLLVLPQGNGSGDDRTRAEVADVAASLPASLRAQVLSIQALDPAAITLVLRHDRIVRWGSATRSAEKARVVAALIARKPRQIDVTDPDLPYTN